VRANARPMPKAARKPIAAPTAAQSPLQRATGDLLKRSTSFTTFTASSKPPRWPVAMLRTSRARLPLTMLLQVILDRLAATSEKVDAARPRKEHANA
jgi:hypothetical protein